MRYPLACAALAAAFLLVPASVQAQDFGRLEIFRVEGLPPGDTLSIREAPDADSPALGQAPSRGRLRGFGCTNDTPSGLTWCRVKLGPIVGWARRRYLTPE
ncbi:peptide-binding protein [Methylobacterium indicum]|uniref:Peptide-binding protein n=1 Tax=Methylobacterium indicum TaxID=1775910 RepID=A0A0J6RVG7_9HYPH|nr:SH3 domain-containing protein [Methylobacterium indicum]KMO12826.1 peptide-binding protein [Methylobacterium indicum]KMO26880.1 peptide-binding protein [Methylobacterium indicum]KTS37508.1 peptide-binding protein [Methylobacterium indicum]KTS39022.1 peptide-binding protein [Methylobacterium indicum]KTS47783.1 peptide-binding protein [Methylobacterium indicum]